MVMIGLQSIALALFLLGLPLVFLAIKKYIEKEVAPAGLPDGTMGWPLLGETLGYLRPHKSTSIGNFLQQHCSRYGRVFKSNLFGHPTIVSCDLELNTFILQNEEKFFQTYYPKAVVDILGNLSMMLVTGNLHKKLRNVALSFISMSKSSSELLQYIDTMSISLMKSWKGCKDVVFFREAKKFTLHLMLKYLLDIEPDEPIALKIFEDFLTFMRGFVSVPVNIPGTPFAKAVKARSRISSTIKQIIQERQKSQVGLAKGDFLADIMLKENLNEDEKVSVILDLLLAGYETTSGLMALVVYFLGRSPNALQTLKEEHQALRKRKKEGEFLTWEDYKQMEFTLKVNWEALRCGNLVKFLHRKALQDVQFKKYLIPAGWQVIPVLSATHLDASLHPNPSEFDPWRWNDQTTSKRVTPFGGGLRLCPGAELGKVETAFFLHHLVLNYKWKIKEDECPISHPFLEFKRGMLLEIEPIESVDPSNT